MVVVGDTASHIWDRSINGGVQCVQCVQYQGGWDRTKIHKPLTKQQGNPSIWLNYNLVGGFNLPTYPSET